MRSLNLSIQKPFLLYVEYYKFDKVICLKSDKLISYNSKIKLDYFDIYITTEPLNLISLNNIPIFQTIHDIIPLEFNPNILNTKSFYRKIKYSSANKNKNIDDSSSPSVADTSNGDKDKKESKKNE